MSVDSIEIAPTLVGPLPGVQEHFMRLYGERNLFVNGPFADRVIHMVRRVGRIADSKRKDQKMPERLAKAVNYFFSLVNYFGGRLNVTHGMMAKFPSSGCAYCSKKPCSCESKARPEPQKRPLDPAQLQWSIGNWQKHLLELYGPKNIERGFWEVFGRMVSEFGEFGILNASGPARPNRSNLIIEECELEAADLFSWIIALAYVEQIDLQDVVAHYYSICPGCSQIPCGCPIPSLFAGGDSFANIRRDIM